MARKRYVRGGGSAVFRLEFKDRVYDLRDSQELHIAAAEAALCHKFVEVGFLTVEDAQERIIRRLEEYRAALAWLQGAEEAE